MFDLIALHRFITLIKTPLQVSDNVGSISDNVLKNFHSNNILHIENLVIPFSDHRAQLIKFYATPITQNTQHSLIKKLY